MKKNITTLFSLFLFWQGFLYAQTIDSDTIRISVPSANWTLSDALKGFDIEKDNLDSVANSRYILATKKDIGMTVSISIEKASYKGNQIECRSFYWESASKTHFQKDNVKLYEKSDMAFVKYDVKNFQGKKVDIHHLNAYLSHGDYWFDVHISKTQYKKGDSDLFKAIVNSLKFTDVTED
jgi:hypothetical protein